MSAGVISSKKVAGHGKQGYYLSEREDITDRLPKRRIERRQFGSLVMGGGVSRRHGRQGNEPREPPRKWQRTYPSCPDWQVRKEPEPVDTIFALRLFWGIGFLLFVSAVGSAALLFRLVWRKQHLARSIVQKVVLVVSSLAFCFFLFEFLFAYLIVPSDGFGQSLSSRLWFRRYWHPVNTQGYRDYQTKHFDGRSVLFVVGDSLVAGHGIKCIGDRFPNRLAEMLGDSWEHVVIAQNGWQTAQELAAIRKQKIQPDAIVWSYYINDIQHAAQERGVRPDRNFTAPGPFAGKIINKSFLVNWLYWRVVLNTLRHDYWSYLRRCYSWPEVWNLHCKELRSVIDYARDVHAGLYVVVWPNLRNIKESQAFTDRVKEFFESHEVGVVDLGDHFSGRRPAQLVVNSLDGHPNTKTHQEVARLLYAQLAGNFATNREESAPSH